jgi:hypothetical protein
MDANEHQSSKQDQLLRNKSLCRARFLLISEIRVDQW